MKILMVCLGNICRSPLAHGLLRKKAADNIEVDSAGTGNWHEGEAPDHRMIRTARKHGVDISDLRARTFVVDDFDRFDVIFVMDQSNYNNVVKLARDENDVKKVKLLLSTLDDPNEYEVPDPYFGGDDGFEHVFKLVDSATDAILKQQQ